MNFGRRRRGGRRKIGEHKRHDDNEALPSPESTYSSNEYFKTPGFPSPWNIHARLHDGLLPAVTSLASDLDFSSVVASPHRGEHICLFLVARQKIDSLIETARTVATSSYTLV